MSAPPSGTSARPAGLTVMSLVCFAGSAWSLVAAVFHESLVAGRAIPLYPPIMVFERRLSRGATRWVGVSLAGNAEIAGIVVIALVLLVLGVLLWWRVRFADLIFLGVVWLGAGLSALALYQSNYWLVGAMFYRDLTPPVKLLILAVPVVLLLLMTAASLTVWRHRRHFRPPGRA